MDTLEAMAARQNACPEDSTILGYFWRHLVDIVILECGRPAAKPYDRFFVPFVQYDMLDFMGLMDVLARKIGANEAHKKVAQSVLTPFFGSPLGALMFSLSRATPNDLIAASVAGYRACINWGERTYTKVSNNEATMLYTGDLLGPAWHALGIFPLAIKKACGVDCAVTVEENDVANMNFVLRTRW